jgi:Protein of unknown function (DUF2384)
MTLNIEIPPDLEVELAAKAQAEGISPELCLRRILEQQLSMKQPGGRPLKSSYGVLAQHGPAPSAEEIDESRSDMFKSAPDGDMQATGAVAANQQDVTRIPSNDHTPNTESQQVDCVICRATEVFANRQKALRWLGTPVRALEYATPISLLDRPDGRSAVLKVLDKIEHGVL